METTSVLWIAAAIVGVLFPVYAILTGNKTHQFLLAEPSRKFEVYRSTVFYLLGMSAIVIVALRIAGIPLAEIGLGFLSNPIAVAGLLVLGLAGGWALNQYRPDTATAERILRQNARVLYLLPSTREEARAMTVVAFVAGICEELIYRGFLLWLFMEYLPMIPAVLLANIPFALAHLTSTGRANAVGTFVLALIFTAAYLLTNSLWLAMLLHILVDLYSGMISYQATQVGKASQED